MFNPSDIQSVPVRVNEQNKQFAVCIKNGPPPKGHPANLTQLWEALKSTWASIPVERF